jgi:predicted nucleotidyltransferase
LHLAWTLPHPKRTSLPVRESATRSGPLTKFPRALSISILYNQGMAIATQIVLTDITKLLNRLTSLCKEQYGERLISLAVFGSVGRGTPRPDSDIDLLLVIKDLPVGRIARMKEFAEIETTLGMTIKGRIELSPVLKTPEEIANGSPLFLDMVEDARMLFDRDDFFKSVLKNLKERLHELGARRIWQGNIWYWDLKPDYKQGEIFEI